jgi:hypothetical protein
LSVITPGMVSGRGRRRDQSGRLRGAMSRLQQIGELGGVRGDASRLVVGQGLGRCWVIEIGKRGLLTFPGTADPNLSNLNWSAVRRGEDKNLTWGTDLGPFLSSAR